MPSRLSSLLVRDGLVGVKRMEHAFQRQVIYGGCLDTILLEMKLVPEERLLQYLSLATGLPPATRSETDAQDANVVDRCPIDLARGFRVVPLCFEEGAMRVLVHDPVDLSLLEELANELEFPIQPLVVPEYRFHLVFARMYGGTPNARFTELAKRAEEVSPTTPVGKARSVIIEEVEPPSDDEPFISEEDSSEHVVVDVALPPGASAPLNQANTARMDDTADTMEFEDTERQLAQAAKRPSSDEEARQLGQAATQPLPEETLAKVRAATGNDAAAGKSGGAAAAQPVSSTRSTKPGIGDPLPLDGDYPGEPASSPAQTTVARARSGDGKVPTAPLGSRNAPDGSDKVIATPQRGLEPSGRSKIGGDLTPKSMHPAQVRVELEAAEDRDVIFGLLLRAIRHHTDYAGLLTVQGGAAIGRIAISGDRVDREDVGAVLIPLDSPSAFLNVINSGSPHIGPVATGDPEIDAMIMRMGQIQALPPSALLLPILLRNRVVAVAVGHCGEQPVDVGAVSELLPLAGVAAEAISRLIMKNKAQRAAQAAAADARDPADGEPSRADIDYAEPSSGSFDEDSGRFEQAPTPPFVKPLIGSRTMSIEAEDPQPISAVLTAAEDSETDIAEPAKAEATARAEETLHALFHGRFPGRLDIDRYELGGRSLPPAQHGPLLDVVMRIGPPAYRMLVAKMRDGDRDIRYYATACVAEMHLRGAIPTLIERLFDSDYGIRNAAINALSAFPGRDLDQSLTRVRQALHSSKEDRVQAAANSLASLADIRSIPDLLTAHERGDKSAEHAHRALVQLTKQDYGASNRKWRMWWSKHKHRHRIEWLLDGLSNKDERIRRSSVETLRTLTGEYFDYQYDHPKKDREHGRQRWQDWWAEIGRRRFIKSDENHRSTAVLPGKS